VLCKPNYNLIRKNLSRECANDSVTLAFWTQKLDLEPRKHGSEPPGYSRVSLGALPRTPCPLG